MAPSPPGAEREARVHLHARVRTFIEQTAAFASPDESFDALALSIGRHQAIYGKAHARLYAARAVDPARVERAADLLAVPSDAFKLARIAVHPPEEDAVVFRTSGTSRDVRGSHAMSTLATYEAAALAWGAWAFFPDRPRGLSIAMLAPRASEAPDSSLSFMFDRFARAFADKVTAVVTNGILDMDGLARACEEARASHAPLALLGTSFAFVHALDALGGARLPLPEASRILHTGGFKGRSREVSPEELRASLASTFGVDEAFIVGEYGMTELSSQLYEGTLRARLGMPAPSASHGVFIAPPWLRVTPVDGEGLRPVSAGETGILRFEDLANVDSSLVVQTADLGRVALGGVSLFGRAPGAPPRGCSIAADDLLGKVRA